MPGGGLLLGREAVAAIEEPLKTVPAFALLGGLGLYLLGHVAFRYRHISTINRQRLLLALLLLALFPLAREVSPLIVLGALDALLVAMIVYETRSYGERRRQVRYERGEPAAGQPSAPAP